MNVRRRHGNGQLIYHWNRLSIPPFARGMTEHPPGFSFEKLETAVRAVFHDHPIDGRVSGHAEPSGWLVLHIPAVDEATRLLINRLLERMWPSVTFRWEGWSVETAPAFTLGEHIQ